MIKYRIWDNKNKRFTKELIVTQEGFIWFKDREFNPFCDYEYLSADIYKVNIYIGLNDKNGKEIYEGDILFNKDIERNILVRIDEDCCIIGYPLFYKNSEITGNIYENSELLTD